MHTDYLQQRLLIMLVEKGFRYTAYINRTNRMNVSRKMILPKLWIKTTI